MHFYHINKSEKTEVLKCLQEWGLINQSKRKEETKIDNHGSYLYLKTS